MRRYLHEELHQHYLHDRQMLFLSGPRQVDKTTMAKRIGEEFADSHYFNWDNQSQREVIINGPSAIAGELGLDRLKGDLPFRAFDELHIFRSRPRLRMRSSWRWRLTSWSAIASSIMIRSSCRPGHFSHNSCSPL